MEWFIGVDVGTGSVRACVMDRNGTLLSVAECSITTIVDAKDPRIITQRSDQVWRCVEKSISESLSSARKSGDGTVCGLAFTATCSMVVMKVNHGRLEPHCADNSGDTRNNIVLWMDHRSSSESIQINEQMQQDEVLKYVGGRFLPEMAVPKAKHLVDNLADREDLVLFEFHDYLAYKAIHGDVHVINKCRVSPEHYEENVHVGIDASLRGFSTSFYDRIGLSMLAVDGFSRIGRADGGNERCLTPFAGTAIGKINSLLALQLGISPAAVVGQGVIDCYGGWLSTVGDKLGTTMSMVAGTSTCFLFAHQKEELHVSGIWGPFAGLVKGYFLSQGGQSASGKFLEHVITSHPAFGQLQLAAKENKSHTFDQLDRILSSMTVSSAQSAHYLAKNMFLYGDILGNRTPYNDHEMCGAFIGETCDASLTSLALKYLCALEFLAFQTKQVLEAMHVEGHSVDRICISGSQATNKRFVNLLALVTGVSVEIASNTKYSVVKGAALLGYAAFNEENVTSIMSRTAHEGKLIEPCDDDRLRQLLEVKYTIFKDMASRQIKYRNMVREY